MEICERADVAYIKWLHRERYFVPVTPQLLKLVRDAVERAGGQTACSNMTGVQHHTIGQLLQNRRQSMEIGVVERIARYMDREDLLQAIHRKHFALGVKGWSPFGHEHCQLCGTVFHDHFRDGFCEECHRIEKSGRGVPRDIRWARGKVAPTRTTKGHARRYKVVEEVRRVAA